ncbi:unnamed protein product, partial [Cyprideis torosa]
MSNPRANERRSSNAEEPGTIRYFADDGTLLSVRRFDPKCGPFDATYRPRGRLALKDTPGTKLGENLYAGEAGPGGASASTEGERPEKKPRTPIPSVPCAKEELDILAKLVGGGEVMNRR